MLDGTWLDVVPLETPASRVSALTNRGGSYTVPIISNGTGSTAVFTVSASAIFAQFGADSAAGSFMIETDQPPLVSRE